MAPPVIDVRVDDLAFYEGEAIARPVNAMLGATTPQQLQINNDSFNLTLNAEILEGIESIHRRYTYPAP